MKVLKKISPALAVVVGMTGAVPAQADGGPFGPGGLIRGDVGRVIKEAADSVNATERIRGWVVEGAGEGGAAIGSYAGAPTVGRAIGRRAGHEFNRRLAGEGGFRAYRPAQPPRMQRAGPPRQQAFGAPPWSRGNSAPRHAGGARLRR